MERCNASFPGQFGRDEVEIRDERAQRLRAAALLIAASPAAIAATPKDVLIEVGEHGPNSLDPMTPAANELSQLVACRSTIVW